jgi:hypothetical protein
MFCTDAMGLIIYLMEISLLFKIVQDFIGGVSMGKRVDAHITTLQVFSFTSGNKARDRVLISMYLSVSFVQINRSFRIATGLDNCCSIPGRGKRFFSSPQRPERL